MFLYLEFSLPFLKKLEQIALANPLNNDDLNSVNDDVGLSVFIENYSRYNLEMPTYYDGDCSGME